MAKRAFNVTAALVLALLVVKPQMYALEIEITGNGDGSTSEANVQVEQQTTIEQTNEASVENNVEQNANTGENQANGNTGGEVVISSGDIKATTTISNDLNTSVVDYSACCPDDTTVVIEDNGSESQNLVDLKVKNQTNVSVQQKARVVNNVQASANTGRNEANGNSGNVSIDTGNISAKVNITTAANRSHIEVGGAGSAGVSVKIAGNGADSRNAVRLDLENSVTVEKLSFADIENDIVYDANTGENRANRNLGDVAITTGDIILEIGIENGPINDDVVIIGGCCQPEKPEDPVDPGDPGLPPATQPPSGESPQNGKSASTGSAGADGGDDDDEAGEAQGAVLPATGSFWWLLALLANITMFLMGLYLRLRSGRSPSQAA